MFSMASTHPALKQSNLLDQFYTNCDVAKTCLDMLSFAEYDLVLEPSAGDGAFFNLLPKEKRRGVDLAPAHAEILKQDFFDFEPDIQLRYCVVGNPPFGKNSSLAVRFFNHAATFAHKIAFVLPRTFRKPSIINRLDHQFHLEKELILPLESFRLPTGISYSVPTVFQIWERKNKTRKKIKTSTAHPDFSFIKINPHPTEEDKKAQYQAADFCVRRVGAAAGKIYKDYAEKYRDWKSHYYIKENTPGVERILNSIDWNDLDSPKYDTAGNPSISKHDLISFYIKQKQQHEQFNLNIDTSSL